MTHRVGYLRRWAVAALLLVVLVAMVLTSSQMADLRVAIPALSRAMNWLEMQRTPFDLDHVVFFAFVSLLLRLLLPRIRWRVLLLVMVALAVGTELLQFGTAGRTPKLLDARDDLVGAALGLASGGMALWLAGGLRRAFAPAPGEGTSIPLRRVLAAWLQGLAEPGPGEAVEAHGADAVLATIIEQGVVSVVEARLHDLAWATPMPLLQPLTVHALACRARTLRWIAEASRIQQVLDEAGIGAIWLKGAALAHWLYPQAQLRDVADVDLLVQDHATALRVAELLAPFGYVLPNPHIAGDLVVHELQVWSERHRLELDLHWDLSNGALYANRLSWAELDAGGMPLPGLGSGARALGPVHALLHACMHRAANALVGQQDRLRWLYDIHLLAARFDHDAWGRLVAIASRTSMADAVLTGLEASHGAFATELPMDVMATLAAHARTERVRTERLTSWTYYQWSTFRVLPHGQRLRWLRQLLFPDMAHLRVRYGADGVGRIRVSWRRLLDGVARWRGYVGS